MGSLMGQGRWLDVSEIDAYGCLRSLRAHLALDGISWVQSGSVEIAVGQTDRTLQNRRRHRMAADRPGMPSLACSACSMKAGLSARGSRTPNTTARPRIWFSRVTRCPTSFLRAMIRDLMACAGKD